MASLRLGSRAVALGFVLLNSLLLTTFAAGNSTNTTTIASSSYTNSDVKIAINVPEGDQKTDLYFNFEAPADHKWVGFGIGMTMDDSLMFVVYRSQDNQGEPTVSPRTTNYHNMPEFYNETTVNVLEGSEVTNDKYVVRMHCKSCRNWGDGGLDTSGRRQRFFYALGPSGDDIKSDDSNARIDSHPGHPSQFMLDMVEATGTNGVPAFEMNDDASDDSGDDDDDRRGPFGSGDLSRGVAFHAFVMSFAFSIVFPLGYLFLRLFERVWMHYSIQAFGTLLVFAGVGSGIMVSKRENLSPNMTHPHQIVGIVAFVIVLAALVLGGIGHVHFKKNGTPSPLMKGHRIVGPLSITLGTVNACLGLAWAGRTRAIVGYIVFDLIVIAIIGALLFWNRKRNMRRNARNTPAAQNFRGANLAAYSHVRSGSANENQFSVPPPSYDSHRGNGHSEQHVPLRRFEQEQHGPTEYYSVQPNK
ncbi:hypothetical protein LTS08_007685 [Lithohypha guttulata]|uniref:DOMON domain-containing protein n=1 Tax=Lithohypha guttulata TaxID=1690604 RepID=A0AAN7QPJ8_9EURO|nr:hypothetical protein LTR05_008635 [Lithohypha guttulata]KAK5096429.1 hypothetical protein LTS08_007685 [Lithohypha guttulata]